MFTGIFSSLFHVSKILVTVLWIRIRIGSVFTIQEIPGSAFGSGSTHANIG